MMPNCNTPDWPVRGSEDFEKDSIGQIDSVLAWSKFLAQIRIVVAESSHGESVRRFSRGF